MVVVEDELFFYDKFYNRYDGIHSQAGQSIVQMAEFRFREMP